MANQVKGKISQIIGPVIDVVFQEVEELPKIYDALEITKSNGESLVLEVEQHIGEDMVRCIAMDATDGLQRGQEVTGYGRQITMPIGEEVNGRLFNVVGDAIDGLKSIEHTSGLPIHREAPRFDQLSTSAEVLFTGIKVIDLVEPYAKGGKIGLFGGAGIIDAFKPIYSVTYYVKKSSIYFFANWHCNLSSVSCYFLSSL
jgi:F-type H+-transporting ATPase subunit beta